MSTGKRLAKRSILGTRVACNLEDGKYYPGCIVAVRSKEDGPVPGPAIYSVKIEGERRSRELREKDIIGSGFTPPNSVRLKPGQKVFITFNTREVQATVIHHKPNIDEVFINVVNPENGVSLEIKKRIDDVRLLESRKSARLADTDTDFAKLADMASERRDKKTTQTIDVPNSSFTHVGSRKRRNSRSEFDEEDLTDECAAALVLMKLSCSPRSPISPILPQDCMFTECMSGGSSVSSGVWSWNGPHGGASSRSPTHRSSTPSPPLSENCNQSTDDGIELDDSLFDDAVPRKRRSSTKTMFKCTWLECDEMRQTSTDIERHIRTQHLGRSDVTTTKRTDLMDDLDDSDSDYDHEELFFWTEVEVNVTTWVDPPLVTTVPASAACVPPTQLTPPINSRITPPLLVPINGGFTPMSPHVSSPPTLSHLDMARPAHEDPDFNRQMNFNNILSSSWPKSNYLTSPKGKMRLGTSPKASPGRGKRGGESRKCRKVYGMEQKEQWCTQCKWKKACSRFGE